MTVLTLTLLLTPAAQATSSGAAGAVTPSVDSRAQELLLRVSAPVKCPPNTKPSGKGCIPRSAAYVDRRERCLSARVAVAYYRGLTWERQLERDGALADRTPVAKGKTCKWARYAAKEHRARAQAALEALRRWRKLVKTPAGAICHVFGPYCSQALAVAKCESGFAMTPRAVNGQYLGMFQMGSYARSRYGHGPDPLTQARAAYRYFIDSGRDWSPWQCRPHGGLAW